jgi:chemotaxis protein CheX
MGNILLVEDDPQLLQGYSRALTEEGHRVLQSSDGQDAILKIRNEKFDLIITDLKLPRISGREIVEFILGDRNSGQCPIIISSAFIDNRIIESFGAHGRIHFLPKPTASKWLVEKVEILLDKARPAPAIDVRFVNPILNATKEVVTMMTQFEVQVGKPYVKKPGDSSGDISGIVGVVSPGFKGSISLSFSETGFLKILSKMLNEESKTITEENKDAVAELLNIIFGHAKKVLNDQGMNIQPAIPTIIRGHNHSIDPHSRFSTIVIPFTSPETGRFISEISTSLYATAK